MALTHAAVRARINRAIRHWVPLVGLESWGIVVRFDETKHKAACHVTSLRYEEATLWFNLPRIRAELLPTYAAVEELALHELVHCLLPYNGEQSVSRITRTLLRARYFRRTVRALRHIA